MSSNRSPSPLSSRNIRNSEANSISRKSFNGRPNSLINPKSYSNPFTPANTPTAATDHNKRNSITRKSFNSGSMFQDGKENHKDAFRSPAKTASKNFMSPTISAASKFTPSPRKQILGEKNDESVHEPKIVEQKELVLENPSVPEVNLTSTNDDSDTVKIRPLCCTPLTSPIVPVTKSDPNLPPYDLKKNFLLPRPQFIRYKPNPRIEFLLNKEGDNDYEEFDVTKLEESFNLSDDNSSDTDEKESDATQLEESFNLSDNNNNNSLDTEEKEPEKEPELGEVSVCEAVLEEKPIELKVEKVSKPWFFKGLLGSKTVWFVFVLFLVACFSLSLTEFPPIDLPIYEDVGFLEVYHGSLRFAAFVKESFDDLVDNVKKWSIDQKSYFFPSKIEDLQFFNLTTSPIQEESQFNRHIGTDYIQEIQEFQETERVDDEEYFEGIDDVVIEEAVNEQIQSEIDDFVETKSNLDEVFVSKSEQIQGDVDEAVTEEPISEQIQTEIEEIVEAKSNLDEGFVGESEAIVEAPSEMVENDLETESNQSMVTICVAGLSMVVMVVSTVFYMNQKKSNGSKSATIVANNDSIREESGSTERSSNNNMQKGYKKNKRESLASSSSDFSTSDSFGSFTTFERIAIKHKDEVMLTPIRRSSRLLKNQAITS